MMLDPFGGRIDRSEQFMVPLIPHPGEWLAAWHILSGGCYLLDLVLEKPAGYFEAAPKIWSKPNAES